MYYLRFDNGDYLLDFEGYKKIFETLAHLTAYAAHYKIQGYTWKEINWY